jgi:hypothetical protein
MGDRKTSILLILSATLMLTVLSSGTDITFGETEYEFRSIDGTGNNLSNSDWGSAGIELLRHSYADYNEHSDIAGEDRKNPRCISNIVASQEDPVLNQHHASDFIWQWGQFLDHDISLTPSDGEDKAPIIVSGCDGDPINIIPFNRSINNDGNPRNQTNEITAFIDASNVYGSDSGTAAMLRVQNSYLLKTDDGGELGDLLPVYGEFFMAGDVRSNEQIGLTAMHTLFVREHNRVALDIHQKHPEFTDDEVYQIARKIVGAEMQVITYNEFLPKLLGPNAIPKYSGYDGAVNPGIKNEFSTASYRYGHSQLSPNLLVINETGKHDVPLRDAFFNPEKFVEVGGVDTILLGLSHQKAQEIDIMVVDDVRNFLFGPPSSGIGLDLASLNIERGRDHGIPSYNEVREAYGLDRIESFEEISLDPEVQAKLAEAYEDDVDKIDLWVGGLAEDHHPNAMVGETVRTILIDQFTNLRDGDRFWYQNDPFFMENPAHVKQVEKTTLADVIKSNTNIDYIHHDVFHYKYWIENKK